MEMLSINEAAKVFLVSRDTIYRWIREKKINTILIPSGRKRVLKSEIKRILEK